MNTEKGKTKYISGNARLALITATVFAFVYTLWDILSVYYFPSVLNIDRRPLLIRLGLFIAAGALFLLFLLLSRRDHSVPESFRRDMRYLKHEPAFWILVVWFLWACAAALLAVREGLVSLRFNGRFLFDQFVNFLLLFPLGFYLARRRDDKLLTALALVCFVCFLPYAMAGTVFTFTHRPFSFLGRVIETEVVAGQNRLRLGGNPNTAGIYGALAFTAGLYLWRKAPGALWQILLALGEALILFVLLQTGSRGGIATALIGLLYFALIWAFRRVPTNFRLVPIWVWVIIGLTFIAFAAVGAGWFLRWVSGRKLVTEDPAERAYLWKLVIREITGNIHYLLHGTSSAAAPSVIGSYYGREIYNSHNQLLEVWLGQGTPALCLFLAYLALLAWRCLCVSFRHMHRRRKGSWAAVLFVLTPFLNSMVEVILIDKMTTHASIFCLACGMVCGMAARLREQDGKDFS